MALDDKIKKIYEKTFDDKTVILEQYDTFILEIIKNKKGEIIKGTKYFTRFPSIYYMSFKNKYDKLKRLNDL